MKLSIAQTKYVQVDLNTKQMLEISIDCIKNLLPREAEFIKVEKGKNMWYYDDPYHRHGSVSEYLFREASADELCLYNAIKVLRTRLSNEIKNN